MTVDYATPGSALTPREKDVLLLVGKGITDKEIARLLGIARHTVRHHLKAINVRLQTSGRVEAAVWACKQGWL